MFFLIRLMFFVYLAWIIYRLISAAFSGTKRGQQKWNRRTGRKVVDSRIVDEKEEDD